MSYTECGGCEDVGFEWKLAVRKLGEGSFSYEINLRIYS